MENFTFSNKSQESEPVDPSTQDSKLISFQQIRTQTDSLSFSGKIEDALKLKSQYSCSDILQKAFILQGIASSYIKYLTLNPKKITIESLAKLLKVIELIPFTQASQIEPRRAMRVFLIEKACELKEFNFGVSCLTRLLFRNDKYLKQACSTLVNTLKTEGKESEANEILSELPPSATQESWVITLRSLVKPNNKDKPHSDAN
jgi:hypothetical protein